MISDILAYQQWFFGMQPVGDNASLVFNALDFLGGSGDLIAIRSRGRFNRPFIVVDQIERDAEKATADEVAAVNDKIKKYQEKLDALRDNAKKGDAKLIAGAAFAQQKQIETDIRMARKELRRLNAGKREKIEQLNTTLKAHNMVWAPMTVLFIAIVLAVIRAARAKRYAARRAQA